jgi:hypothetical protein
MGRSLDIRQIEKTQKKLRYLHISLVYSIGLMSLHHFVL